MPICFAAAITIVYGKQYIEAAPMFQQQINDKEGVVISQRTTRIKILMQSMATWIKWKKSQR